jgi:capsular exopolysaccharide synthesis family protein
MEGSSMPNLFNRFFILIKRWWWLSALGILFCGGTTYAISKITRPIYRASSIILLSFETTTSSNDNLTASLAAAQTYAQLLTNSTILDAVVSLHPGLTLGQLTSMMTVTPKPSTALIEVDVDNINPTVAMQLANEITNSFETYAANNLTVTVHIFPAERPTDPLRPHSTQYGAIGALVGLGLSIGLVFVFEWFDDRLGGPEEIPQLLGIDTLAIIPQFSRRQRRDMKEEIAGLTEACRMLGASLNTAQAIRPFKSVMVSSALAGEGKSTIVAHLASFLALAGKRVLLVDADLRSPVQNRRFHLDNSTGLSRALIQTPTKDSIELLIQPTDMPKLHVLTAGVPSANSAELLQSPLADQLFDYFDKAPFDYVLFDTPPMLPVADAQFLASRIEATVLVIDVSKTPRKVLLRTRQVFEKTYTRVLGVALNKSYWPEYGYIREYQRNLRQSRTGALLTDGVPKTITQDFPSTATESPPVLEASTAGDNVANSTPADAAHLLNIDSTITQTPLPPEDPDITILLRRINLPMPEEE